MSTARNERLGAGVLVHGLVLEPGAVAARSAAALPLLTADEWGAWRDMDEDDLRLLHACLNAEFEHRNRQFDALERFGAAYAAGRGDTSEERLASMPADERMRLLVAAQDLGWFLPMPTE